ISFFEGDVHELFLHQPDAVLARDGAAELHAQLEYFGDGLAQTHVPLLVAQLAADDVDVQVAVAGVAVAHALEAVAPADFLHAFQQNGQLGAGHHGVFLLIHRVVAHR
nr:hypothetical protein [Tanacetum cinerariifolium]